MTFVFVYVLILFFLLMYCSFSIIIIDCLPSLFDKSA